MNWSLRKLYKINWVIEKIIGYKRKETIKKINDILEPSNDKKIVYSITCHTNAHQIIRLMKKIYYKDNLYYINLDLKTSLKFYKTITSYFSNYQNVYISNVQADWGKWNQVQIILDIMENALAIDKTWTHFINLSGQDFPLKKQSKIIEELSKQQGVSYIEAEYFPPEHEVSEKFFSLRLGGHKNKKQLRLDLLYPEIKFYKGSQWMILSRDLCIYFINGELPKKFKILFKNVFIPDESFFPTLAANSDFVTNIRWYNKRFIDWSEHDAHPAILTMKYLPKITTGDFYFARKFNEKFDEEVITELEKIL